MDDELWTIGHWTCPEPVFVGALAVPGIETVVDVRAQPGSRRSPQFGRDVLPVWLADAGVGYLRIPELAGRRPRQPDVDPSVNAGWQNQSFHNYADWTLGEEFASGLEQLMALAREQRVAILCGEPMPWRCHRSLIANVLAARGWRVWHLMVGAQPRLHQLGQWGATPAVAGDGTVTYPA
jgi:uncharacterized protein (DUF488 family)